MTLRQARRELEKLGFKFDPLNKTLAGPVRFGTIPAEPYDVSPNHFVPKFRHVWISNKNPHFDPKTLIRFSISSSIKGVWRKYRARNPYERDLANIFSMGKTLGEAVENFVNDFKLKRYNII